MAYTSTPTACPTCGALTFDGRVNVRTWTGDNGAQRFYPAGDHAPVCAANVERAARNAAILAEREAAQAADAARLAAVTRWANRIRPIIAHDPNAYAARVDVAMKRIMGR